MRSVARNLMTLVLMTPLLADAQSAADDLFESRGAGEALFLTSRATRTVSVRNVDERGRAPYMQFQVRPCPGGAAVPCEVAFPPVPAGHRLVLEHVNASINFAPGGVRRTALIVLEDAIVVLPTRPSSDPNLVIVNEPALVYYESGETPIFQIVANDDADLPLITTAVSGYLVTLDP